jgi:hypothetical protein
MNEPQTVEQLTAGLPELNDAALTALREAEVSGENRTTALAAIDAEVNRRAAAALKDADDQAANDAKAQTEGFADHAAKVDADAAAVAAATKKKLAKAAKPTAAQAVVANERGLADAREAIDQGKADLLLVGFGDERKPFKEIPFAQADMRSVGPRLVTGVDILMRTGKLTGTVTVTHVWLIGSPDSVLARAELGAPMVVSPNQQIKIAAGRLAFN